jgi:hypothetical protein
LQAVKITESLGVSGAPSGGRIFSKDIHFNTISGDAVGIDALKHFPAAGKI